MEKFTTNKIYTSRNDKSDYIFDKYQSILKESILDVGADECHLNNLLNDDISYTGIGLGSKNLDLEIDLEKEQLPYSDNSFHTVLCFDVLEHLDNLHDAFDELCRVSKNYLVISLPNPYREILTILQGKNYKENQHIKFYGLPPKKPTDRHKWFFSSVEAENFIKTNAEKNNMKVVQIDKQNKKPDTLKFKLKQSILKQLNIILDNKFFDGTIWAVLQKKND